MLQLCNFRKSYKNHLILQVDALDIAPGVYWVQGANGSGKSTFLKALAGITPFEGNVILNQETDSKKQSVAYRSAVNFAEAEPIFPDFLTGIELIKLFKSAKQGPEKQEEFYLETMQMSSYVHDPISTYSSGMLKKLSLVLAFIGRPECILLDEPLNALDADALPVLYSWIATQQQEQGTMFLLSSHQVFSQGVLPALSVLSVENNTVKHST
ncbi:ABC transporter ATP-binding protein [Hymenobacter psychrophilus]|uniref:ABC-2 type transport system ATP-binding protein n=1 Tax=Hymenobacter psychrophilus TaxID=651662 RepID=A0A1H3M8M0_9BACT|nr:ABC transporter ATP-binding protein [Hymenobacter psychrophilus]SDY73062.1 ABC-2 type transport system ATP-binding protein [Hymenobacter psychrophilus]